jgi:hypothetical protein
MTVASGAGGCKADEFMNKKPWGTQTMSNRAGSASKHFTPNFNSEMVPDRWPRGQQGFPVFAGLHRPPTPEFSRN